MSAYNGHAMLLGGVCKLLANSTSSSGDSSNGSSSDSGSSDVAQAGASQAEDIDVEDVPTTSSVNLTPLKPLDSSVAAGAVARDPQGGLWIQPNVVRPADLPSGHPDEVHAWGGWPKFPPNKNADRKRSIVPSPPPKVPHVALVHKHEFLPPKMELRIHTQGRFMQPRPSFRGTNLVDDLQYTSWLSFTDAIGGECAREYSHPDSPNPGSSWNGRVLSFSQMKLFTYDGFTSKPPPITLKCNRSYRVQMNVGIVDNSGHILSTSVVCQGLGAHFVAVPQFHKKPSLSRPINEGLKIQAH